MSKSSEIQRIPLQFAQNCVIASIQIDLTDTVLYQFRQDLLTYLYQTKAHGLILDLSGVEVMDMIEFQALTSTIAMASLMGAKTILCGFQPGVVSALVNFSVDFEQIHATLTLDNAFELMEQLQQKWLQVQPTEIELLPDIIEKKEEFL
ncbi:STAS domain-containing protein [Spirulina subsalsa FACHB-351]|uniref:STAS domain-containing protein n=1 Tax=Spirulina subsalsa FACHB-351 TaxID=234711 RepID=A0ABT3L7Q1_9CYAN|nr:STAS domain-containing protein [Spirulina subsalsa]MCW6036985.1 STAS domain-containing protein [Spirulina subsalsa FACHB-351]